jgi:hypothetical protein
MDAKSDAKKTNFIFGMFAVAELDCAFAILCAIVVL